MGVPATLSPDPEPEPQTASARHRASAAPVVVDQSKGGDIQAVLDEFNAGDSLAQVLDTFDRLRNLLGVERSLAATFAITLHLGQFVFTSGLGGYYVAKEGLGLSSLLVKPGSDS